MSEEREPTRRRRWWRRVPRGAVVGLSSVAMLATVAVMTLVANPASAESTSTASSGAESARAAGLASYDAEALARGFFFGLGPVAQQYPKLVLTKVEETPENLDLLNRTFQEVKRVNPAVLGEFASAVVSGDRVRIRDVTGRTVNLLQETLARIEPVGDAGDAIGQCLVLIAISVVAVVLVEIKFWIVKPVYAPSEIAAFDLKFEKWVDAVAATPLTG